RNQRSPLGRSEIAWRVIQVPAHARILVDLSRADLGERLRLLYLPAFRARPRPLGDRLVDDRPGGFDLPAAARHRRDRGGDDRLPQSFRWGPGQRNLIESALGDTPFARTAIAARGYPDPGRLPFDPLDRRNGRRLFPRSAILPT